MILSIIVCSPSLYTRIIVFNIYLLQVEVSLLEVPRDSAVLCMWLFLVPIIHLHTKLYFRNVENIIPIIFDKNTSKDICMFTQRQEKKVLIKIVEYREITSEHHDIYLVFHDFPLTFHDLSHISRSVLELCLYCWFTSRRNSSPI